MLKITALAVGFLTIVTISPARATNFQVDRSQPVISGRLYAEKLLPIKKSAKLAPTVIKATSVKVPIDRKVELSAESKERQRIQTACQSTFGERNQFKPNERPVGMFENSPTANTSNLNGSQNNIFNSPDSSNSSANQGSCGFSIGIPY